MNKFFKMLSFITMFLMIALTAGCEDSAASDSTKPLKKFPTFNSKDLAGNQITNDIFAKKKLTVVNIWGTFCPPCIGEMPELAQWSEKMSNDVQLIGIVCDVNDFNDVETINEAKKILGDSNAKFVNIIPNSEFENFLSEIEAVPTTIFVDGSGNILNKKIVGADVDGYKDFVKDFLNE